MLSLRPVVLRHWKTVWKLFWVLAAVTISSTYCAHWFAWIPGLRCSWMKLENADSDRLSPCANLRHAIVLLVKLNTRNPTDCWSARCRQWCDWEESGLLNNFFCVLCCAASVNVLTGWFLLMQSSALRLFFCRRSTNRRCFPLGLFCANFWLEFLLKDNVATLPYLRRSASSTRISSLRISRARHLRL